MSPTGAPPISTPVTADVERLREFLDHHPRLVVLTGAGCSTESGIPDYRDAAGAWKRKQPVQYADFVRSAHARRRYWARSMQGYPLMAAARPNAAHRWLADREVAGAVELLVTQNVDGLHSEAGSRAVVDLHGRISEVVCLDCGMRIARRVLQERLENLNPAFRRRAAELAPDGDADIADAALDRFRVPLCDACGGMLKPDVVFFGESVPRERVERTLEALGRADGLLVLGSSLMIFSGFRFCREAHRSGLPMAVVNLGRTRADDLVQLKIEAPCASLLEGCVPETGVRTSGGSSSGAR